MLVILVNQQDSLPIFEMNYQRICRKGSFPTKRPVWISRSKAASAASVCCHVERLPRQQLSVRSAWDDGCRNTSTIWEFTKMDCIYIYYNVITFSPFQTCNMKESFPKHFLKVMDEASKLGALELWYICHFVLIVTSQTCFMAMYFGVSACKGKHIREAMMVHYGSFDWVK